MMTDLATTYLGLTLRNPVVASAGPLSQTVAGVRALADGGVGAVVLYSLFEEQLRREAEAVAALEEMYEDSHAEALSYFPTVPRAAHDASRANRDCLASKRHRVPTPINAILGTTELVLNPRLAAQQRESSSAARTDRTAARGKEASQAGRASAFRAQARSGHRRPVYASPVAHWFS